jgi:hypothetical protein
MVQLLVNAMPSASLPDRESTQAFDRSDTRHHGPTNCCEGDFVMTELITNYLAGWNETDVEARRTLIDRHWSGSVTYVDPMVEVVGRDDLNVAIGAVQQQFPDFFFTQVGDVDAHHRQARFQWGLGPAGAEPVIVGFDVVVVVTDADGRIERVLGFLDRVPG